MGAQAGRPILPPISPTSNGDDERGGWATGHRPIGNLGQVVLVFATMADDNNTPATEIDQVIQMATRRRDGLQALLAGPDPLTDSAKADLKQQLQTADTYLAGLLEVRSLYAHQAGSSGVKLQTGRFPGWMARPVFAVLLVGLPALGAFYLGGQLPDNTQPLLEPFTDQIALLAFMVALAAYLQTVAKDLKAVLKHPRDVEEDREHWNNFALVLIAEMAIVLVGVATAIRIIGGPLVDGKLQGYTQVQTDMAIVAGFVACVLFLAALHVNQWYQARKM